MASCNLGVSKLKISSLDFGRVQARFLQPCGLRTCTEQRLLLQSARFVVSNWPIHCVSSLESKKKSENYEPHSEETKYYGLASQLIPSSPEVENLLTTICDTTSISEFDLKLAGFRLHVVRDLSGKARTPSSTSIEVSTIAEAPESNNYVATPSVAMSKAVPSLPSSSSSAGIQNFLDRAGDEGLAILQSPRVGFFRRSRTIKGKRAPPSCKEKQLVKEGQVICYIEQLGGELPIESDVSGEVIRILRRDGEPVGYGDALIAILPSFPGIKKLQ